ncbi:MAG: ethanolamine utilization protein EutH [Eubacteriales bacterium]|nr:ethanolamine utilization protein EutH [Eubacteriales bacterium]
METGTAMEQALGINEAAGTGLLASLASIFPALALVKEMDAKGKLLANLMAGRVLKQE